MSLVAVVMLSFAFASCTNEDDIDFGAVGNWSVECTSIKAPGLTDNEIDGLITLMNKEICLDQTLADPEEEPAEKEGDDEEEKAEPLDLTKLTDKSETQAKYYLEFAMESCYQYLNNPVNSVVRESLTPGSVITFTLYRVTADNTKLVSNTATVTVTPENLVADGDFNFDEKK